MAIQSQADLLATGNLRAVSKPDVLQVWADIDDHLQFADQIIQESDLPISVRTELLEQVKHIRLRRADPNMYLAVVGEFSTGKSTFINALLREELLKASVDVTTATSARLCYGAQVDLEVRFRKDGKTLSYRKDREQLWQRIRACSPNIQGSSSDIRACIDAVTSDNAVTPGVDKVIIRHPSSFLTNGIVIIDTPGINSEHAAHAQIANDSVKHEADAAVVIIPAPVPLASSMAAFLADQLRPFIHRCVFVVTQMDKIPEREQKRLLENIRTRLVKALGTEQLVTLYASAPQVVLEMLQEGNNVAPELQRWSGQFSELECSLWERLRQERALSITESLLRLLTMLFEKLGYHLQERRSSYEARQAAIQRETIQDISSFTAEQRRTYQNTLTRAAADARSKIEKYLVKHSSETEESMRQVIFGADSAADLKSVVPDTIKTHLGEECSLFQQKLQKRMKDLERAAAQASQSFDQRFTQEYQRLQALAGTATVTNGQSMRQDIQVDTSTLFYSADRINEELDGATNKLGWGGAAVGAAIGTAVFPGIGTLAGLLVGPLLVGLFGPSLDERKTKLWEAVQPALDSCFEAMGTQAHDTLNNYEREVQTAFDQRLNAYMQRYKATVDQMIRQQQHELAQVRRLQLTIQANQKEIERRSKSLKQKQQRLAKKSIVGGTNNDSDNG